ALAHLRHLPPAPARRLAGHAVRLRRVHAQAGRILRPQPGARRSAAPGPRLRALRTRRTAMINGQVTTQKETTGADVLLRAAVGRGVSVCFANPGTTEMPLVTALDRTPGMRAVLGLHENVCTGAADGYARITGHAALTLLHLGPGLANGLANLHNARRARSPVVNVVGDHMSWHRSFDAPLTSDIAAL